MPEVRGTVVRPNGLPTRDVKVEYRLVRVGSTGLVHRAVGDDGRTYVGVQPVELDADGTYQVMLPANAELDPPDTLWARTILAPNGRELASDPLIVPVGGGPYIDNTLLTEALDPLPAPVPTNLLTGKTLVTDVTDLEVNAFASAVVPGTVVTVPDVARPTILRAKATVKHSVADSRIALAIVPEGALVNEAIDVEWDENGGSEGNEVTMRNEVLLDPHSPGSYQLSVYSFTTGTMTVVASPRKAAWLRVWSA